MEYTETEFNSIYSENRLKLMKHTYVFVRDYQRSEEIVQEAFARLVKYTKSQDNIEPTPWLFVVCRNLSFKLLAKNKRLVVDYVSSGGSDDDLSLMSQGAKFELTTFSRNLAETAKPEMYETSPYDSLCSKEDNEDIWKTIHSAMASLSSRHQKILKLRYFDNLSYGELAKVMKTTEGNVGFMLHDAKRRLKKAYREENYVRESQDGHDGKRRTIARATNSVQSSRKRRPGSSKVRGKGLCC